MINIVLWDLKGEAPTQMTPGRVSAPGVIVLPRYAFESGSLVDRHRARAILVFLRGILNRCAECGETIRLAGSERRLRLGGGQVVVDKFWVNGWCHFYNSLQTTVASSENKELGSTGK